MVDSGYFAVMPEVAGSYMRQLPSGAFRVIVFADPDPATRRRLYFKSTVKTEPQA
jgi:hypothetical protein